jgi:hypothetical protein
MTHDWRDVGDGIRSRVGRVFFYKINTGDKDADSIFLTVHCRAQPGRRKPSVRKPVLPSRAWLYMQSNVRDQVQQDNAYLVNRHSRVVKHVKLVH